MRLTEEAINAVKEIKPDLMKELGCSEGSINRYIRDNESNNPLTTAGALELIRKTSKLTDDVLLEREAFS